VQHCGIACMAVQRCAAGRQCVAVRAAVSGTAATSLSAVSIIHKDRQVPTKKNFGAAGLFSRKLKAVYIAHTNLFRTTMVLKLTPGIASGGGNRKLPIPGCYRVA
jgi:hypothetical protein